MSSRKSRHELQPDVTTIGDQIAMFVELIVIVEIQLVWRSTTDRARVVFQLAVLRKTNFDLLSETFASDERFVDRDRIIIPVEETDANVRHRATTVRVALNSMEVFSFAKRREKTP